MAATRHSTEPLSPSGFIPVAIYTRVSTDNQVGGRFDSCESQAAICRDYIRKHAAEGWQEVACYTDAAYSGGTMDRPGFKSLKRQIEAGEVKIVVIFKLERMSRNMDEWGPFRAFLQKHGCRLVSATEEISEVEPEGRLKNNIMMSVAEFERLNTAKKTRLKMLEQAKRGIWNGGMIPFGYSYDRQTQRLVPHPQEAAVVRRVFEEAARLVSLERIADSLNSEGLRTKARIFRGRDGVERYVGARRFRSDGLRIIVGNPLYRGELRYKGNEYRGQHEPLVAADLWEKANAAVVKTTKPAQTVKLEQDKNFHLLKGLVICGCCHRALVPHASGNKDHAGKPYRYYDCSHVVKERRDSPCPVRRIAAGSLERAVVQFLSEVGRHPDIIIAAVGCSRIQGQGRRAELKNNLEKLDRELAEANKGIRNCVAAIVTGGKRIAEELTEQVTAMKDRKQELVVERERVAQELAAGDRETLDERRVCDSVARFGVMLRGLSPDEQKALVSLFIERIEVRPAKGPPATAPRATEERRFELSFKLNIPRLVEGMEERLVIQTDPTRSSVRRLTLSADVSLGQQGRANEARVVAPFESFGEGAPRVPSAVALPAEDAHHPLVRAIAWQREMARNPKLSLRGLARKVGVVAPTITQHFKLLKLAPEIRDYVARLRDPKAIYFFSLRRLTALAVLSPDEQVKRFGAWRSCFAKKNAERAAAVSEPAIAAAPPTQRIGGARMGIGA